MQIQYNYANIESSDTLEQHIAELVDHHLGRFKDNLTRIEVHLGDENSTQKSGAADKRCMMEARPEGLDPIAVEAHASEFEPAIQDAVGKLKRALASRLDRD